MALKFFDIRISISPVFIVIIAIALVAGMYIEVIAALLALGVHEYAHVFVGRKIGLKINEIEILPFGGRIKSNLDDVSVAEEMLIVLAGPLGNFVMVGFIFFLTCQDLILPVPARLLTHYQLMLGIFNMLPALPLDGGRIFVLWLRRRMSYTASVRIASQTGKILGILLLLLAFLGLIYKRALINFFIAGFFLFQQALKAEKNAQIVFMKHLSKKKEKLHKNTYLHGDLIITTENTPVKKVLYLFDPQKYFIICVLNKNMEVQRYLTETEIFDKVVTKGLDLELKDLI